MEISLICQARQQGGVGLLSEWERLECPESSFCTPAPAPTLTALHPHGPISNNCIKALYLGDRVGSACFSVAKIYCTYHCKSDAGGFTLASIKFRLLSYQVDNRFARS